MTQEFGDVVTASFVRSGAPIRCRLSVKLSRQNTCITDDRATQSHARSVDPRDHDTQQPAVRDCGLGSRKCVKNRSARCSTIGDNPGTTPDKETAMTVLLRRNSLIVLGLALVTLGAGPASSQAPTRGHGAEAHDMELVGHDDLQGRSAYQPTIHQQRGRWIAYVGHHGGRARNPLTGAEEDNGTSVVDVTDPAKPRYLAHIPRPAGGADHGGAQMARVLDRQSRTYLLPTYRNAIPNPGHEGWDLTDPAKLSK